MLKNATACVKLALLLASVNVQAVTVSGTTVDFTFDPSLLGLFGSFSVVGDTLKLEPVNFSVLAKPGATANIVSATASEITITSKGGNSLNEVTVSEQGSYNLIGNGDVHILGSVDVNGDTRNENQTFSSFDEVISSSWSLTESFASIGGSSTKVNIDNVLAALIFDDSSLARINKTGVSIGLTAVPIPPALWMLGAALLGMSGIVRRK